MPGLTILLDLEKNLLSRKDSILDSLDSLLYNERYQKDILIENKAYILACTKYKEYPFSSFENDDYLIFLEGEIYPQSSIKEKLFSLVDYIFQEKSGNKDQIVNWLLNTDGDFVIFILNKKKNEITILNDLLQRLPLYYYKSNKELIVSREIRLITNLIDDLKLNKAAIAQYLMFRFSYTHGTLFKDIYRVDPGILFKIDLEKMNIEIERLYNFNFDDKKYSDRTLEQNIIELTSLFTDALKNRALSKPKNIVSLTGGLDSRTVATTLHKNEILLSATTYTINGKKKKYDVVIAEEIAKTLKLDWNLINIEPADGKNLLELLKIKDGLQIFYIGHLLNYIERVIEMYGTNLTMFTGDLGEETLQDLRTFNFSQIWGSPHSLVKNLDQLLRFILSCDIIFNIDRASKITQIDKETIIEELRDHVLSYPEEDLNQKFIHFMIYERAFKFLFEGQDRNRFYYWSSTPFTSIHFFQYALNCSDDQKEHFNLYYHFIKNINPKVADITYANYRRKLGTKQGKMKDQISGLISYILFKYPRLKKLARKVKKRKIATYGPESNYILCLKEQINNCKALSDYLSIEALNDIIENCDKYSHLEVQTIVTITSFIEKFTSKESTLEKFSDALFT